MYLQLRGSTYYFRYNIPPQYRHVLGWSIVRPLCSCPVISDTIANTLGQNPRKSMPYSLDDTTIKQLVDKYIKQTLETIDHYINTGEAVSRDVAQAGIEAIQLQQTEHEEALSIAHRDNRTMIGSTLSAFLRWTAGNSALLSQDPTTHSNRHPLFHWAGHKDIPGFAAAYCD